MLGGGNVVQGYYKNPEQTKKDFITIDDLNYFCTGDIGVFEADGTLKVIGGCKQNITVNSGYNVLAGTSKKCLP